jgi:hypothetical protein
MSIRHRQTLCVNVEKQHACRGCGALFAYPLECVVQAEASTKETAQTIAKDRLSARLRDQFALHPCPSCGIYQPEMVLKLRADRVGLVARFAAFTPAVLAVLVLLKKVDAEPVVWWAAGFATLALGFHVRAAMFRPNASRERNRALADREVSRGPLRLVQPGSTISVVQPGLTIDRRRALVLAACAITIGFLPSAAVLRSVHQWPLNDGWVPPVVGPGDTATLEMGDIESISGLWAASGAAQLSTSSGAFPLPVDERVPTWGTNLKFENRDRFVTTTTTATIHVDAPASLAGQSAAVRAELDVEYPVVNGFFFEEKTKRFTSDRPLLLASPGAGTTYSRVIQLGMVGGSVVLALLFALLLRLRDDVGDDSTTTILSVDPTDSLHVQHAAR